MGKATFFTGQPLFNQILSLIPKKVIAQLTRQFDGDRYCKKFRTIDHLFTMLFSTYHQCNSLREVITGMQASASRLKHLGLKDTPRRSTLADSNKRRDARFFEALFHQLHALYYGGLPDSLKGKKRNDRLFVVDSSIVSLFSDVLHSTGSYRLNGKKKGGAKVHSLLRAKDNLPALVYLSEGKESDSRFLPKLALPKGSIIVMDKGYRLYEQFAQWTEEGISWVTRLHGRAVYTITKERALSTTQLKQGVQHDYEIQLGNPKSMSSYSVQRARLVVFTDPTREEPFQFLTNNFTYSAATIADIYKQRWQIELFFKRIKQNFQLHYFLGDNENAIRIQIWTALIADLLLKVIKDQVQHKRKWSMSNLAAFVRLHLGTYIDLFAFLCNPDKALINYKDPEYTVQLSIFSEKTRGA